MAERLILPMKVELVWTCEWETITGLRAAIEHWTVGDSEARPHQVLKRTPAEQRAYSLPLENVRQAA